MSAIPANGLRAADIHARLGTAWPSVLAKCGIGEEYLRLKKAGPCPACGGHDRYTFDNRRGRGDFYCRSCGAGDGFALLERVHGWNFTEARRQVLAAAGMATDSPARPVQRVTAAETAPEPTPAAPPARVRSIARGLCAVADCPDAIAYLQNRCLWPLPEGCQLRAHPGIDYFDSGKLVGRYPALVAEVRDASGELATVHVTYLEDGRKLATHEPRKILSKLNDRVGCAARVMPAGEVLGIAEGIETALSATAIDGVPVWAALNTALLAKFEPPPIVHRLVIYADRDVPGLLAAGELMQRLQRHVPFELRGPTAPHKDFNDEWLSRMRGRGTTDA